MFAIGSYRLAKDGFVMGGVLTAVFAISKISFWACRKIADWSYRDGKIREDLSPRQKIFAHYVCFSLIGLGAASAIVGQGVFIPFLALGSIVFMNKITPWPKVRLGIGCTLAITIIIVGIVITTFLLLKELDLTFNKMGIKTY